MGHVFKRKLVHDMQIQLISDLKKKNHTKFTILDLKVYRKDTFVKTIKTTTTLSLVLISKYKYLKIIK